MRFLKLRTSQFRNLAPGEIPVDNRQVFLIGTNGQGKTNFLEAIYTLCYGSSFRGLSFRDLAVHGEHEFKLSGEYVDDDGFHHTLVLEYRNRIRSVSLDAREIRDRKELIYNIPCIVFSHEDIAFVQGDPEARRKFFDQTMSMYNPLFFDDMRRYRAILKQRNQAIKEQRYSLLDIYDMQLAEYGIMIQRERTKAVHEFEQLFPSMFEAISQSGQDVHIDYVPSWSSCATKEEIVAHLKETRQRDIAMLTSTSGIHRDRFVIVDRHGKFAQSGSTGQLRLASLILRTSQMAFFKKKTGKDPILLVDDVLLEIDAKRREAFLQMMDGYSQAFFTFLPEEHYLSDMAKDEGLVYDVVDGRFLIHEG